MRQPGRSSGFHTAEVRDQLDSGEIIFLLPERQAYGPRQTHLSMIGRHGLYTGRPKPKALTIDTVFAPPYFRLPYSTPLDGYC